MTNTSLTILAIGIPQLIVFTPIILILYFVIPKRKYKEVSENEIDETIKSLNLKERISFKYKNVKVSLKRVNDSLLIEPYRNKITELGLRFLGFFLSILIILIPLNIIVHFLDSMGVGDRSYGDGTFRSVSWRGILNFSSRKLWFVYVFIFYFIGRLIKSRFLIKLLIWKHKKNWKEFNLKYSKFRY